jgi:hypothetical protein
MTMSGRPTSRRHSRATEIVKRVAAGDGEHRYTEWLCALLGVGLIVFGAALIWQERGGSTEHQKYHGGLMIVGLLLVPGASSRIASRGGRLARAWKTSR